MRPQLSFVVSATALIAATYGLARYGYGLFVSAFGDAFGLSSAVTGGISAAGFLAYCGAALLAQRLPGRPRATVLLAGATAAVGSAGVALAPSAPVLVAGVVLAGTGAGFASPGLVALVEGRVRADAAGRAQAVVNAGTGLGVVLAGPLALTLDDDWRVAWGLIALANVLATAAVLITSRRRDTGEARPRAARPPGPVVRPLRAALAAATLAGGSSAAVWTFGRSTVEDAGGLSPAAGTLFWVLLGAAGVAGAISGDLVSRLGLRRSWRVTTLAMAASTVVVGAVPSSLVAAGAAGALFGGSYVALSGVLIVWAARALPGRAGPGTAALFIALSLGQAAGAAGIGLLLDVLPTAAAFGIAGVVGLSAVVPAARAPARGRPPRAPAPGTWTPASDRVPVAESSRPTTPGR
jgi:predicted MFS family arabinose efflux permease